ncbi:hypothetical protein M0R45_037047 [Rubus argutus]|uniref:F-box domain-containing protein n=1 Tax=Rubus argutus TaxID=59490 RepID=A0AAW1VXW9_RUBAR
MSTNPPEAEEQNPIMEIDEQLLDLSLNHQMIDDRFDRRWEDLPSDCLINIFEKVGTESLLVSVPFVCKSWCGSARKPSCWKRLILPDDVPGTDSFDINGTTDAVDIEDQVSRFKYFMRERCARAFNVDLVGYFFTARFFKFVIDRSGGDVKFLKLPTGFYDIAVVLKQISQHCNSLRGLNVCDADVSRKAALAIVKFVPKINYLWLRRARISREDLVTLLQGCKELQVLDARECSGFDEGDEEISELASSVPKFMCEGSRVGQGGESGQRGSYGYPFGRRQLWYIGLCGLGLLPDIGGVGAEEAGCSGDGATSGWAHSKGLDGYGVWADEIDGCPDLGVAKPP